MTKNRGGSQKGNRVVRAPATKFAHLRKRLQKAAVAGIPVRKKGKVAKGLGIRD